MRAALVIANRAAGGKGGRVICRAQNLGMVDKSRMWMNSFAPV